MTYAPARRSRPLQRCLALLFASLAGAVSGAFPAVAQPLPALGVEPEYTVSGLSSGGYMAAQFAVVHSSEVVGLGVFQGGPYDCALGDLRLATSRCSCLTPPCAPSDPSGLATQSARQARLRAAAGLVDPVAELKRQRVWLYSGGRDATVPRQDVEALGIFYRREMKLPAARLRSHHIEAAGHGLPVTDTPDAVACGLSAPPFLNDCSFDGAGELLRWLLPAPVAQAPESRGRLIEFDQRRYSAGWWANGLGERGYVYVPDACADAGPPCRLHVVFHGCRQGKDASKPGGGSVGSSFVEGAGYNRWAAGSRLVVLYPQVAPNDTGLPWLGYLYNPRGCWDFWGYTHAWPATGLYATRHAPQIQAVRAMVQALQRRP